MKLSRRIISVTMIIILIASALSVLTGISPQVSKNINSSSSKDVMGNLESLAQPSTSTATKFTVYFNETGLPSGTMWAVNVSGTTHSSINSSILFHLSTGSYTYTIKNTLNFYTSNSYGQISVIDHNSQINVSYNGRLSVTGYLNFVSGNIVNSSSTLTTNMTVFPVYGIFDNFSHSFVILGYSNSLVYEVNQYNQSLLTTFNGPSSPLSVDYNPTDGNLYILNSTTVFLYSPDGLLLASHYFGKYLISVVYDQINGELIVGNLYGGLYFLNSTTLVVKNTISDIKVFGSQSFAYNSALNQMEVINDTSSNGNIVFLNGNNVPVSNVSGIGTIMSMIYNPVNNSTYYIGFLNGTSNTYIANSSGSYIIPHTGQSYGIGFSKYLNSVLVTNTQNGTIQLVNTSANRVSYTISGTGMPLLPLTGPGNSSMFVVNPNDNALDIVTANDFVKEVNFTEHGLLGATSWGVSVNNFWLNSTSKFLTFYESPGQYSYSASEVIGYIGPLPSTFTVANSPVNISVTYSRTYGVTFTESGLPSGVSWGLNFNGNNTSAISGSSIAFSVPNGTYSFSANSAKGYDATPTSGYVVVNGEPLNLMLNFSMKSYSLNFVSSGVPAGTTWTMVINGVMEKTSGYTISFNATPGTYQYTVNPVHSYYPQIASGAVNVSDSNMTVYINWLPYLYKVNFTESGLPTGSQWTISINNNISISSVGTNASAYLQDGTYTYGFTSSNQNWKGGSGLLTVNGSALGVKLNFTPVLYKITFKESGLPYYTYWSVSVAGTGTASSYENSTTIYIQNGSYLFSAETQNSSFVSSSGSFSVHGSNVTVGVLFNLVQHNVTFREKGLTAGTVWGVYITGSGNYTANTTELNVSLPIGQHSFSPLPLPGYNSTPGGYFNVGAGNLSISINFTLLPSVPVLYNVTIYEMGLPESFQWAIILNDTMQVSYPEGLFNLQLTNGTYNISLISINPHGKVFRSDLNLTLTVNGSDQNVIVLFYGPYVWLVVDFGLCSHNGLHDQRSGHHSDDSGNITSIYIAGTRPDF